MNKLEQYRSVAREFAEKVKLFTMIEEVAIFASVAGGDPYPSDVDLALFLNSMDPTPKFAQNLTHLAKVKRQFKGKTSGFDVFVFGPERKFMGNICFRATCPGMAKDCTRAGCGDFVFIEKREGLKVDPLRWFRTPVEILFQRGPESILLSWQKELLRSIGRDQPESYPQRKTLVIKCRDCGHRFEFDPGEQKHFEKMGFDDPKRCQKCRDQKFFGWNDEIEN